MFCSRSGPRRRLGGCHYPVPSLGRADLVSQRCCLCKPFNRVKEGLSPASAALLSGGLGDTGPGRCSAPHKLSPMGAFLGEVHPEKKQPVVRQQEAVSSPFHSRVSSLPVAPARGAREAPAALGIGTELPGEGFPAAVAINGAEDEEREAEPPARGRLFGNVVNYSTKCRWACCAHRAAGVSPSTRFTWFSANSEHF